MNKFKLKIIGMLVLVGCAPNIWSAQKEEVQKQPSQEMVEACKTLNVGDKCSYLDDSSHKFSGSCIQDPRAKLCFPETEPKKEE
jgi:hypothetical protein